MSGFIGLISSELQPGSSALLDNCQQEIAICCNDYLGSQTGAHTDMRFGWLRVTDDTEPEQQPFTTDQQTYITGDVRLDNREQLIIQLSTQFNQISNRTPDTCLVLYAYLHWGGEMMQHLAGDFAFAIWNEPTQTLFCARDHFGIIPLYYAQTDYGFLFTNYYRALKHIPGLMDELEHEVLLDYFFGGRNDNFNHTIYKNIQKLPPAHQLIFVNGELTVSPYWQLTENTRPQPYTSAEDYAVKFNELFERSVTDRLRNNHISCHLSGGMDSSSITAVSKKVLADRYGNNYQLTAYNYTLGTSVIESEGFFAKRIARHLDIPIRHYLADSAKDKHSLSQQAAWFPEPAGATNVSFAGGMIADTLSTSRITLCGFGGDPLFEYHPNLWLRDVKKVRLSRLTGNCIKFIKTHGRLPPVELTRFIKKRMKGKQAEVVSVPAWFRQGFFSKHYLARKKTLATSPQRMASGMFQHPFWSFLFEMSHPGFSGLPMKFRQPFFSLDLFMFMQTVPPHLLYNKLLMRLAMLPYLPAEILQRPKTLAYSASSLHNMKNTGTSELLNERLQQPPAYLKEIIDAQAVLEEVNNPVSLKKADLRKLTTLATVLIWKDL